ncbi:uncharacterized protein MEPE_00137 [Melanopsichium pennsylvanicum]|uniref:Uncharacterized protein n=2 Tax=Melanopsichium pennsylvanicum TaxID=63383 RepID=A0AAJ4XG15_9BASI|nr:hypothetical protein BN887_02103 [Melanopsichium pennsylvanicum 4]SNX81432.1 uncharacterized protein MEPE_00137 [Melanopsichium pennsylvanicum]
MTSAVPAPPRGYGSLSQLPPSIRSLQPMPAPLSRVALAAKQNQIIALQALQAAAASSSASSASSSAGGSPPPSSSSLNSSNLAVHAAGAKRGRKFQAFRASSLAKATPQAAVAVPSVTRKLVPLITTSVPHWSAEGSHPLFDPNSGKRSEIYSLTNDRYPGAPGTALAKAREAQHKAVQAAKREAAKKLASKAELEHLGVKGLGKKRKSSSPYANVSAGLHATAVAQAAASGSKSTQDNLPSPAMSRDSSRGRSSVKPTSEANLTVPSASRSRRPASRASSPAPITAQTSSGRRTGTRSGSAAPAEDDVGSSGANTSRNNRNSPSRGTSPPEAKNHHGLASTAPFQSSPLAASAITMEPLLDPNEATRNDARPIVSDADKSPLAARATAAAAIKRKASTLSQEVHAGSGEANVGESLEELSKRLKRDGDGDNASKEGAGEEPVAERAVKEASPSSVSSSRRTSPRMASRNVVDEVA